MNKDFFTDKEAQMYAIEAVLAAGMMIAALFFVVASVPPDITPAQDFAKVQLKEYGRDALSMIGVEESSSPGYDNNLQYLISTGDYSALNTELGEILPDNVEYNVILYNGSEAEMVWQNGWPTPNAVVVSKLILSQREEKIVRKVEILSTTFGEGSLIIPMDYNQAEVLKAYGLVYNVADDSNRDGTANTLDDYGIPVWNILEDPRGITYPYFSVTIRTDDDPTLNGTGVITDRSYAGGPFVIDADDMDNTTRDLILGRAEELGEGVTVHELRQNFTYNKAAVLRNAPRIAVYAKGDAQTVTDILDEAEVPYTLIGNDDILENALDNFDIFGVGHNDMDNEPTEVILKIINWVDGGGILYAQCKATTSFDEAEDIVDTGRYPWYGFIGVEKTNKKEDLRFIGNASGIDNTGDYGSTADPGAPFNPLAQIYAPDGLIGEAGGSVKSFKLVASYNPDENILAVPYQSLYPHIGYIEAPYGNGHVIYMAGHKLQERGHTAAEKAQSMRIFLQSLFYPTRLAGLYDITEIKLVLWYK